MDTAQTDVGVDHERWSRERVNATRAGRQPSPKTGNSRRMTARLGMTRTAATAPTSAEVSFPPIDASTPIGMNTSMAMPSAPKLNSKVHQHGLLDAVGVLNDVGPGLDRGDPSGSTGHWTMKYRDRDR